MIPIFRVQDIDHEGIVAAICDEIKLVHLKRSGCLVAPLDECQAIKGIDTHPVFISGWFDGTLRFNYRAIILDSGDKIHR
ncbi:MAG: hypothetical protein PUP92_25375 [Rhizonema sp. PD38]|nr:hypothetical protein [Rhizonema sp. PD38]